MTESTRFRHYDRCDPPWRVVKLTRAGHHLWHQRRKFRLPVEQREAIDEALEIIWQAKREVKAQTAADKNAKYQDWKASRPS